MTTDELKHKYTNSLINETSPYLLQHAHNPVDWHPWNEAVIGLAQKENKLLLISIGYSACHWCHVMEHECFEDEEVAQIMNEKFICIKVDREERPDIDQIYMNAVQLMTGRGGWPLNCFALPTGEPIYGGTYFPKENWMHILRSVAKEYEDSTEKVIAYAKNLTEGIKQSDILPKVNDNAEFSSDSIDVAIARFKKMIDYEEGGPNRAPKFPLPNNYEFLLQYYYHTKDEEVLKIVELTLNKMAYGGIYDQIGGGFARYSVDSYWKVPHFEKMLYDNGQLVSLYSQAYKLTKKELYKEVVYQTLDFVEREMTAKNCAYYSALDADSEGEEGKYYVWNEEELLSVLGKDYSICETYYNINHHGKWEGNYILLRKASDEQVAEQLGINLSELKEKVQSINAKLLDARSNRVRPGLDDKTLTSWNALMLKGYIDAYNSFGETRFLEAAKKNAEFIISSQLKSNGGLNHNYKNGISNLDGYLEDYSFTIEAFIALYEATFEEKWLTHSKNLIDYTIQNFYDEETGFFFFTSKNARGLIARKMELSDNVIPASNSSLAKGLFLLGKYYDNPDYNDKAKQMLKNIEAQVPQYVSGYSNWAILMLKFIYPFYEIAITGNNALEKKAEFSKQYIPNKLFVGSTKDSKLALLENKYINEKTMIYVCYNKACQKPTENVKEAIAQLK